VKIDFRLQIKFDPDLLLSKKVVKSYAATTVPRLSSLSRGTKTILVSGCAGALLYLSFTWFTARRAKKKIRSQVNGQNTAFIVPVPVRVQVLT
jgi:hypothetical protein